MTHTRTTGIGDSLAFRSHLRLFITHPSNRMTGRDLYLFFSNSISFSPLTIKFNDVIGPSAAPYKNTLLL